MIKKFISTLTALLALVSCIFGQGTFQPREFSPAENLGIVYEKEVAVDLRIHTNGYAVAVNFGKLKTYYLTKYYHFEFGELKHNKEYRNTFDVNLRQGQDSRSYVYGKQNNLFVLRAGLGQKRYFSEKAKEKGVAVGMSYEFGPALGLLKPYYLDLDFVNDPSSPSSVVTRSQKYSAETAKAFLDLNRINGASGILKGIGETKIRPGIQAKAAMHFDWGAFDEFVKSFEAGIMADLFFQKMPIMVELENVENQPFFINLYLNLQFGKRW